MRTSGKALMLASFIGLALGAGIGAQTLAKPTAEITRFQVEAITLRDITFLFELTVKNPYPVGLSFSGMSLDFSVEGAKVFSTASKGGFSVGARGKKSNVFTVTLTYDAIIKLVKDYTSKDWLNTVINGKLVIPLPKIPGLPADISFSYKLEKKIPAIKPVVSVTGFTVRPPSAKEVANAVAKAGKKVDADKARSVIADVLAGKKPSAPVIDPAELDVPLTVTFTLEIRNDARAALSFDKLQYELFVNGESLVVGTSSDIRQDGQRIFVTVTNTFSSKRLSANVKALFSSRKGSFGLRGSATIKLPDEIRKEPIQLGFDETGSFSLR
ncbi:MAG: hypothetical protein E4H20_12625 [Spirochaetales bacterium]|nr:MAG: hypothetical protein E4H20_12625 [Spirochaetales bacterium]